jgi:Xaa-Pro aminopeptidase
MDYEGRQKKLQSVVASHRLDGLLVTFPANVRYLCGFTGSSSALLITQDRKVFFTDGRYTEQAQSEVQGAKLVIARKAALAAAGEWLARNAKKLRLRTIGIEAEHMSVGEKNRLAKELPSGLRFREVQPWVEQARMVKEAEEIERLRAAAELGSSLFEVALKSIRPGVKEVDVAAEMEYAARRAGADAMSFETIIASGPRSALPHGRASQATIPTQGFVVCDFGVILAGYCSDRTRTVHVGQPSNDERRIYRAVQDAQEAAIAEVKPGTPVSKVDHAARKLLAANGFAKYFTHSTGHGVGLEIHEPPRIAATQRETLAPGMVVTVEPGVYLPGSGGVRIEDTVVVTETGCEVLTPTSKDLIVI